MIVAKVAAPNVQDRFVRIEPGTHTVGSGLECDVVLLDGPILPHHLTVHASDDGVEIEMPEDAAARFEHALGRRVTDLRTGDRIKWFAGDRLCIEDISIELEGVPVEDAGMDGAVASRPRKRQLALICAAAFLVLVPVGVGSSLVTPDSIDGAPEVASSTTAIPAPAQMTVRQRLEALGAWPDGIEQREGSWTAIFYVADFASRQILADRLSALDFPLTPTIYVDEQLKEAARITLANVSDDVTVNAGMRGRLTLSLATPGEQAEIRKALLRDVPGLTGVDFETGRRTDPDAILANVTGLWHGRFPYVVLADQTVVRPGQELCEGATLVAVMFDHLLVKIGDVETKVYLP